MLVAMTLLDYISDMDRRRQLAEAVSRRPEYLWQIATARRSASPKLAISIEEATDGVIAKHELRGDIFPAPQEAA